uniref:Uncharacterized protein n=1 Tax=Panagrellus redivivus TaxID=6233 RepID=A0A7E4V6W9_PANRE
MVHLGTVTTLATVIFSVLIAIISAQGYEPYGYGSGQANFAPDQFFESFREQNPIYNRALRSNGKPTFIRFGKRSFAYPNKPAYY